MGRATCVAEVMLQLTRLMKRSFGCRLAVSYALEGGSHLVPYGCCGLPPGSIRLFLRHNLPLHALPLLDNMVQTRHRLIHCGQLPTGLFTPEVYELFPPGAFAGFPMQVRGRVLGAAFVLRDNVFSNKEMALLGWTVSHAALALSSLARQPRDLFQPQPGTERLQVDDEHRNMLVNTVSTLVNAIEAKSPWTKGHSERVMRASAIIAAAMGLDDGEVERVRLAGLLHDIGKIGADGLLDYPGRLDQTEEPPLRQHPEQGVAILAPIAALKGVLPGILHHHERFDGKGYPGGLRGEEIPLDARIIAVADAFDAIVSERPYKSGSGRSDALAELEFCAGTQFDPEMVRCLTGFIRGEGLDSYPLPG